VTRILGLIVHNWPLKLAAVGLATLLYGGLVLSQSTIDYRGVVPVAVENQPPDTFLLTPVEPVTVIRYFAPSGVRPIGTTFTATIDLSGIEPGGGPRLVPIVVASLDDRITVLSSEPDVMTVELDALETRTVKVVVEHGPTPDGLELGDTTVEPAEVEVSGPSSVIDDVVSARADVVIQPGGIDIDQDVRLIPIDQLGDVVTPVDVKPSTARVQIPVFTDRQSRTVPVSPVITGTPAAGFEIESVTVDPSVVTVEGDADQLVELERIDTAPVTVSGLSSERSVEVALVMPTGVVPLDVSAVQVTVTVRPVTATRSFDVGLRLVGTDPARAYEVATDRVLITVGGSIAELDRLVGATLVADLDVAGLTTGPHDVRVTADLPAGVTLVSVSPSSVTVTVGAATAATPAPTSAASPGVEPTPSATASPSPGG
jgi:YbbR domain-containing protein